ITLESVDQALYKATERIVKQQSNAQLREKYLETRSSILQKITAELLQGNDQELLQWMELISQQQQNWTAITVLASSQAIDEAAFIQTNLKLITVPHKETIVLVLLH